MKITNEYTTVKFSAKLQHLCMQKVAEVDYGRFEDNEYYNYITTITREINGNNILNIFMNSISILGAAITIIFLSMILIQLGIIPLIMSIIFCIPGFIHQASFGKKNWEFNTAKIPLQRKLEYLFSILSSVSTYKENRIYNTTEKYKYKYKSLFNEYYSQLRDFNTHNCWKGILMATIHSIGTVAAIAYAYFLAASGSITLGSAVMFVGITQNMYYFVQNIVFYIGQINEEKHSIDNILSFENEASPTVDKEKKIITENVIIELKNVTYAYPGSTKNAIDGVSFVIQENEKIAIVGENGSGKTTLAKIILGLYKPDKGLVKVNGTNIKGCDLRYATACFQDYFTYSLSIRENVAFGNLSKLYADFDIMQAIRMSKLDQVTFYNDLDHNVSRTFYSNGIQLSGGQAQKLSLARAFIFDKGLLILDEPSASLDVVTENEIFESTLALMENRSTVVITHRLANVISCDTILYLENGKVVEQGTHDELMQLRGKYYELFTIQAEKYKVKLRV